MPRWLAFIAPVVEAGARAIFGFPLQVGTVRLGAMNLYCDRPGALTDEQHADALVMADIAAQAVLLMQAKAPPGALASELEAGSNFQYVVHQASGMVAAQLGVSVAQALIRLRGSRLRRRPPARARWRRTWWRGRCASRTMMATIPGDDEDAHVSDPMDAGVRWGRVARPLPAMSPCPAAPQEGEPVVATKMF